MHPAVYRIGGVCCYPYCNASRDGFIQIFNLSGLTVYARYKKANRPVAGKVRRIDISRRRTPWDLTTCFSLPLIGHGRLVSNENRGTGSSSYLLEGEIIVKTWTLSILQLIKCVVYCAVASACVAPMFHLWRVGVVGGGTARALASIALFEAIVIPVAWVGLSVCLIRRGAWRDALITSLLLSSVCVALGFAFWTLGAYTIPAYKQSSNGVGLESLSVHIITILTLVAAALFLAARLRRGFASSPPSLSESSNRPASMTD
jgi:hypothetical protein